MKGLKVLGTKELERLRNRAGRQYGLGRISREDFEFLSECMNDIQQRIDAMEEVDDGSDEANGD